MFSLGLRFAGKHSISVILERRQLWFLLWGAGGGLKRVFSHPPNLGPNCPNLPPHLNSCNTHAQLQQTNLCMYCIQNLLEWHKGASRKLFKAPPATSLYHAIAPLLSVPYLRTLICRQNCRNIREGCMVKVSRWSGCFVSIRMILYDIEDSKNMFLANIPHEPDIEV